MANLILTKKTKVHEYDELKVIQPTQSIHYINCDKFQSKLNQLCPLRESDSKKIGNVSLNAHNT